MAAGLGFKTFTTGEVLTAADTNGYLMQGVLVFDDAAARDAAITAPAEGQFAYLKDTDTTTYYTSSAWANLDTTGMVNPMTTTADIIYSSSGSTPARLGIGSTDDVLTVAGGVPTWAAPAAGGSYTLISTATPSAAATFEFTSIPGTYKKLYLVGSLVPSADGNGQNYLEFNSDTGSLYRKYNYGSAGAASVSLEASNQMQVHNNMDNVKGFSIAQEYHNYTATNMKIMTQYVVGWQYDAPTTAVTTYQNTNYIYGGTSAISNIKFYAVTGTYSGTVSLYGQN
jgi:hypothetical protein